MAATSRRRSTDLLFADCDAVDVVGDVVRVIGDAVAGVYQSGKINLDDSAKHLVFGVVVQKLTSTRCVVQTSGEIRDVYTGLTPGKVLFVNMASRLSHTVPTHPTSGTRVLLPAALALSSAALLLQPQVPTVLRAP